MSRRERFWFTAAIVAALTLIAFFLMGTDNSAGAQSPSIPIASAAPEPPPDIVRHFQVEVDVAPTPPPRVVPQPKPTHKVVVKPKAPRPRAIAVSRGVSQFLACVAWKESRDNYRAENPTSTASGKYQFIDSSWRAYSQMAGYPGWSHAAYAPPAVQEAVARWVVVNKGRYPWAGDHC